MCRTNLSMFDSSHSEPFICSSRSQPKDLRMWTASSTYCFSIYSAYERVLHDGQHNIDR